MEFVTAVLLDWREFRSEWGVWLQVTSMGKPFFYYLFF